MRLDKYLADMGCGTRSQLKAEIRKGAVTVNEKPVKSPELPVTPGVDVISYHGQPVLYVEMEYYMLNKPAGCVSATEDKLHPTVLSFLNSTRKDLFPVGRLDMDTEGLLLITNDGPLAHRLLSPKKHVPKTYYAKIDGEVTQADIRLFEDGVDIGEAHRTRPARLRILSKGQLSEIELTIYEGKYHQVKRMFEAVGKSVVYLKRTAMGSLQLDAGLKPGEYRPLTKEELSALQK